MHAHIIHTSRYRLIAMLTLAMILLSGIVSYSSPPIAAQENAWSAEERITPSSVDSLGPDIAIDSQGVSHVVYVETDFGEIGTVYYRHNRGGTWSDAIQLSTDTRTESLGGNRGLSIDTVTVNGVIHLGVAYNARAPSGRRRILYRASSDAGLTWTPPEEATPTAAIHPFLLLDDTAQPHLIYIRSDNEELKTQYTARGAEGWEAPVNISENVDRNPSMAYTRDEGGNLWLHAFFQSQPGFQAGQTDMKVLSRVRDPQGAWRGAVERDRVIAQYPSVVSDYRSQLYAVWSAKKSGYDIEPFFTLSINNGESWHTPVPVGTLSSRIDQRPEIARSPATGLLAVVWESDYEARKGSYDIFARMSADNGGTWGELQAVFRAEQTSGTANIDANPTGGFRTVWDDGQSGKIRIFTSGYNDFPSISPPPLPPPGQPTVTPTDIVIPIATPTATATPTMTPSPTLTPVPNANIDGSVTAQDGPLAGVTISTQNGQSVTTDSNGHYTFNELPSGSYTLTPAKTQYTFSPASITINVPPDATNQNFVATRNTANDVVSGFRFDVDRYRFPNYGSHTASDFALDATRRLFGENAVCQTVGDGCVAVTPAREWTAWAQTTLVAGQSDGMASTALRFFKGLESQATFQSGATTTIALTKENVRQHIAEYAVRQLTTPLATERLAQLRQTPVQVLQTLRTALAGGAPDPVVLIMRQVGRGGHSVVPFAVEDHGDGIFRIRVYDSNWPDLNNRFIEVNTAANTWNYSQGGQMGIWSGTASSASLGVLAISRYDATPMCPWCDTPANTPVQLWASGPARVTVNTSAQHVMLDGGLAIETSPLMLLPSASEHTIQVNGTANSGATSISQFGANYAISVEDLNLGASDQTSIRIAPDGTSVTLTASTTQQTSVSLMYMGETGSIRFHIENLTLPAGQPIPIRFDAETQTLRIDNTNGQDGSYTLAIERLDEMGVQQFLHEAITLNAGATHTVQTDTWNDLGALTVGTNANETITLLNQTAALLSVQTNEQGIATVTLVADTTPGMASVTGRTANIANSVDVEMLDTATLVDTPSPAGAPSVFLPILMQSSAAATTNALASTSGVYLPVTFTNDSPTMIGEGTRFSITPLDGVESIEWDFGDQSPLITTGAAFDYTHYYTRTGTFTATATLFDVYGGQLEELTSAATVIAPSLTLTSDSPTMLGDATTLVMDIVNMPESLIETARLELDLGDGNLIELDELTAGESQITHAHTYSQTGTYPVRARIIHDVYGAVLAEETTEVEIIDAQAHIVLTAADNAIRADGRDSTTITARVTRADGSPAPNVTVLFGTTKGTLQP